MLKEPKETKTRHGWKVKYKGQELKINILGNTIFFSSSIRMGLLGGSIGFRICPTSAIGDKVEKIKEIFKNECDKLR